MKRNVNATNKVMPWIMPDTKSKPAISVRKTLGPVPIEEANLEVESGEQIVTDADQSGLPAMFTAGGKRHYAGGTPLNLPPNSFIFSRDKSMSIKDEAILEQFGKAARRKGYTLAELAKRYDINEYRGTLLDKDTDNLQRNTAEMMITNYNEKLAKLSLVQESTKGFPDGIPAIAIPYLATSGLNMNELFAAQEDDTEDYGQPTARYGGGLPQFKKGGQAPKSNRGQIEIQYANPFPTQPFAGSKKKGGDTKKRVKITPPNFMQKGGVPTYDSAEAAVLRSMIPGIILPEDTVESKQPGKSGVFGRFDQSAADKNWRWYGKKINWSDPKDVETAQRAYNDRIRKKVLDAGYPTDYADMMVSRVGFVDKAGVPNALDKKAGKYTETRIDFDIPVKTVTPPEVKEAVSPAQIAKQIPTNTFTGINKQVPADFWLQDIVKTAGAAADSARIKKYHPWQATYNPYLPSTTYYDPTRELAANAETANLAAEAAMTFAGPQQSSARLSAIQGQAAQNAANILGKYNNLNVGVANQSEQIRAGIINQAAMRQADSTTNLYDKTVILNQQFDNAKAAARGQIRQSFLDALTNRAQTQALNAIQKQYRVDPLSGGLTYFTEGRDITPEGSDQDVLFKKIEDATNRFPGTTPDQWAKIFTGGK